MLSGVSHDLHAPHPMRLTVALMDESGETRDLQLDMEEMGMCSRILAFARGDSLEETVETDPFALADSIAENARRSGAAIELQRINDTPTHPTCRCGPARSAAR